MPRVIVVPHREVPGVYTFNPKTPEEVEHLATVETHQVWDLEKALETVQDSDAHFFCYSLRGVDRCPRINKLGTALAEIRADGQDLLLETTALDWDTEGHVALDDASWAALQARIEALDPKPTFYYRTRAGARLLFAHDPVTPEDAERLHVGLVHRFMLQGLECDQKVWGWARESRLPNVLRDGKPLRAEIHRGPRLDHATIERKDPLRVPLKVKILRLPHPTPDEIRDLIWDTSNKKKAPTLTSWAKTLQPFLKGRLEGTIDHLFDPSPRPLSTPRNDTVMRWAGCVTSVATTQAKVPETTPQHVYALFEPSIAQSDPHKNGRDLYAEAWKMILYCWAHEEAKVESKVLEAEDLADTMIEATLRWPNPPTLPADKAKRREWLMKRLVVCVDTKHYIMQADGQYSRFAHSGKQLFMGLRDSGIHPKLIDISPDGKDLAEIQILNRYSSMASPRPRFEISSYRAWLDGDTFVQGAYHRRTDIKAEFNAHVDQWLRRLFGERYEQGCRWIGLALAIERGPICALSLSGAKSVGKGMFVNALAECFSNQTYFSGNVFGTYQYGADESPILWVDEGWPERVPNIADTFRKVVGGTTLEINKKNQPIFTMRIAPRVVMTANNRSVVGELFRRKVLGADDETAIQSRYIHFDVTDDAARWLKEMGGQAFTRGWIKGASSSAPSDYVIAKHFMWLHEKHGQEEGTDRFLMEGSIDFDQAQRFALARDEVSEVGQVLSAMLRANSKAEVAEHGGNTWVDANAVQDRHQQLFNKRLPMSKLKEAIKPFLVPVDLKDPKFKVDGKWIRGFPVDRARVKSFEEDHGLALEPKKLGATGPNQKSDPTPSRMMGLTQADHSGYTGSASR